MDNKEEKRGCLYSQMLLIRYFVECILGYSRRGANIHVKIISIYE